MTTTVSGSSITFNDNSTQNTAATGFGFKNRIINGAMVIDQRNAGAATTPTAGAFSVDRWAFYPSQASKFTIQQNRNSVTPPDGFTNYLGFTVASSVSIGSGDYFTLEQAIEGFNVADLAWGTANAKTVTLSFWVRSSLTGTFGGALYNSAGNYSYAFNYTISSANTWEQKTVTITGPTTGTFNTNNAASFIVTYSLGVGSIYSGTAGIWAASNLRNATGSVSVVGTNGATFYITGVQLEKGSTATSFDYRPYTTELQLCQRYCYVLRSSLSNGNYMRYALGDVTSTTGTNIFVNMPVTMRSTASVTTTGTASNYEIYSAGVETVLNAVPTVSSDGCSPYTTLLLATVASGLTAGRAAQLISNGNQVGYLIFSAEL